MPTTTPLSPPPRRAGSRLAFVVAGVITATLALALAAGGGIALWAHDREDAGGFLSTDGHALSTDTPALVSDNLDIDLDGAGWLFERDDFGRLKLTADATSSEPLFVGIARTRDVDAYLAGVARTVVTDVEWGPFERDERTHDERGAMRATAPGDSPIWVASSEGAGDRAVEWDIADGDWSVVVMNADGSPRVDADLSAGAQVPWLAEIGWTGIGGGALLGIGAVTLLLLGIRRPPSSPRPAAAPYAGSVSVNS